MNPTTVRVTGRHIAEGLPENQHCCPIALALTDALTAEGLPVAMVSVEEHRAFVQFSEASGCPRQVADLPREATAFIWDFDTDGTASPFETELSWREMTE